MPTVKFTRNYMHCRRTANGGWVSGHVETSEFEIPESKVKAYANGSAEGSTFSVVWPDGHRAHGTILNRHATSYDSQLDALLA